MPLKSSRKGQLISIASNTKTQGKLYKALGRIQGQKVAFSLNKWAMRGETLKKTLKTNNQTKKIDLHTIMTELFRNK